MNDDQIRQEISTIKNMIEKTKAEAAESGLFFIALGLFAAALAFTVGMLEFHHLDYLILPGLIAAAVGSGVIGYFTKAREEKREKVKSYPKTIFYGVFFACGISILMLVFLFPLLKVYPWSLIPTLTSVIMGIVFYSAGITFELISVRWCSMVWWAGAVLLAMTQSRFRFLIMVAIVLLGWVLPGFILNRHYKNRAGKNES